MKSGTPSCNIVISVQPERRSVMLRACMRCVYSIILRLNKTVVVLLECRSEASLFV